MIEAVVQSLKVFPLTIPLRTRVSHSAARRKVADPVVVAVELRDGTIGYGETLPRPYVTGETVDSVVRDIAKHFANHVSSFHASNFSEALNAIESLPWDNGRGGHAPAARAAVELALLDAVLRKFQRTMDDVVRWMGLPGFGSPGSLKRVRFSGVIATKFLEKAMRQLRIMYWCGLRDFKLKVGFRGDTELLKRASDYLRGPIANQKASLRVDVNGGWDRPRAVARIPFWDRESISFIEQPLPRGSEEKLAGLRDSVRLPIMHDESLITIDDARKLIDLKVADGFNIRLSKCGGMLPSLRIAALAKKHSVRVQLGCMVGETSILSAAGVRFLQVCPHVTWAEGCYGKWLLTRDIARRRVSLGFGGRPPKLGAKGLGFEVDQADLGSAAIRPLTINL